MSGERLSVKGESRHRQILLDITAVHHIHNPGGSATMKRHVPFIFGILVVFSFMSFSCSAVQEFQKALTNLQRCTFKLDSVSDFTLAGVPLTGKSSFSIADGLKLLPAFQQKSLPASFDVNVAARNPNDGTGGTPKSAATLTSFAWTLLIDSTVTVSGNIANPITIPGTGQQVIIPLHMNLDLYKFFRDRGYESLLNLALALGGANRTTSRVALRATPSIRTDFGSISYPGEITIIDKEFRGQ
jgi:hypothetical protein